MRLGEGDVEKFGDLKAWHMLGESSLTLGSKIPKRGMFPM
jgi:hypothetical protein